jgi:hypothetical protein
MIKTLPKEVVREMELELAQEVELELRIQEAWWTFAGELKAETIKLAG